MRLNERDLAIVDAVHRHRVLSTAQIAQLFFPSSYTGDVSSNCRRRLRGLVEAGFLHRDEQEQKRTAGRLPYLFMLTEPGVQLLMEELGLEREDIDWRPDYNDVRWPFLRHQLAINDALVAFKLATEAIGWRLQQWTDDRILRKQHIDRVYVPEHGREVAVVPDAFFRLESPDASVGMCFFLEIDRATMTVAGASQRTRSWQDRIRAYQTFIGSDAMRDRYGTRRVRVLTITTTEQRLNALKIATESVGGRLRYWFTTTGLATPRTVLIEPIWWGATVNDSGPLLEHP